MENTKIQWATHTFNPWIGCAKVSDGCKNCYAETLNNRYGWSEWGKNGTRKKTSPANWRKPLKWSKEAEINASLGHTTNPKVFCASLADVFEDHPALPLLRYELFDLIEDTPNLDWLILTKRPDRALEWFEDGIPFNVWLGTSVEDQKNAKERIPTLLSGPDGVRFLSCEPLLGPLDLTPWLAEIDWVIVGGESGPKAREMDPAWARSIRDQCHDTQTPFFMKQMAHKAHIPADLLIRETPVFKV